METLSWIMQVSKYDNRGPHKEKRVRKVKVIEGHDRSRNERGGD